MSNNQRYMYTRREFLETMAVSSAGMTLPSFLGGSVARILAGEDGGSSIPGFRDNNVLVVVQLSGGNDGLNMVVPYGDDNYHKARPSIGVDPSNVLKLNDYLGLHKRCSAFKELYDRGLVSIINGVGYPNPNRSHFRSMKIWHSGNSDGDVSDYGWIGRYHDNCCDGRGGTNPAAEVNIGGSLPLAMKSERGYGITFNKPEQYRWRSGKHGPSTEELKQVNKLSSSSSDSDEPVDFLRHTTSRIAMSTSEVQSAISKKRKTPGYPDNGFANDLKRVASLIGGGLPTRVYYVSMGGFDTHSGQRGQHENLMEKYSEAMLSFQEDLKMHGLDDRVLTLTFSEFGRRVEENASNGTDHGKAGPMFLVGKPAQAGIQSDHPDLSDLDNGDLKHTVDFRSVYATVLEHWFSADAKQVLGQTFDTHDLIKT